METTKRQIRVDAIEKRRAIPFIERMHKSMEINERVGALLNSVLPENRKDNPPVVALYSAMRDEVDLSELAHGVLSHQCRACFPAIVEAGDEHASDSCGEIQDAPYANDELTNRQNSLRMQFFDVSWDQLSSDNPSFLTHQMDIFTRESLTQQGFSVVDESEIDVVIVPVVAFDDASRCLCTSSAYYPALLSTIGQQVTVIGVAFSEQKVDEIPTELCDVTLSNIVHN